jgi:sarcosine oxidase subunit beta
VKVILCRCEDVTLKDVVHSIELGYDDIEEVKRYTGFGTGPCQGKECHALIASVLAERTARAPSTIPPFTARSPICPTPLGVLARAGDDGDGAGDDDGDGPPEQDP